MKKVLILGSSGQIGTALTEYLSKKYYVEEFDIAKDISKDLRNRHVLDNLLKDTDFVFFLAFDVGGSTYLKQYQETKQFVDNNMKIMLYTFESLEKYKTPFIFASSQMANMSYSNYGILKHLGEKYTNILNGITVKFWNVYGIEKDEEKFHVITDFIKAAKNKKHISIKTSGEEERQFLHADDCCECLEILMNKYEELDRAKNYHITSFEWTKIIDIAKLISSISNTTYSIGEGYDIQLNKKNEADPYILNFWKPKINLETGIRDIYNQI